MNRAANILTEYLISPDVTGLSLLISIAWTANGILIELLITFRLSPNHIRQNGHVGNSIRRGYVRIKIAAIQNDSKRVTLIGYIRVCIYICIATAIFVNMKKSATKVIDLHRGSLNSAIWNSPILLMIYVTEKSIKLNFLLIPRWETSEIKLRARLVVSMTMPRARVSLN